MAIAGSSRSEIERRLADPVRRPRRRPGARRDLRRPSERSRMTMASPSADDPSPASGASSELRRSVGQATERIHEIIDAAERVAVEIRSDAEAEAERYLEERRREADRLAGERTAALDQLTKTLANSAERFKHQAEQMLADLDRGDLRGTRRRLPQRRLAASRPSRPRRSRRRNRARRSRSCGRSFRSPSPSCEPVEPEPSEPSRIVSTYSGSEAETPAADADSGATRPRRRSCAPPRWRSPDRIAPRSPQPCAPISPASTRTRSSTRSSAERPPALDVRGPTGPARAGPRSRTGSRR